MIPTADGMSQLQELQLRARLDSRRWLRSQPQGPLHADAGHAAMPKTAHSPGQGLCLAYGVWPTCVVTAIRQLLLLLASRS
jgi:hypothetical protein